MRRSLAAVAVAIAISFAAFETMACEAHDKAVEAPRTLADGTTVSRAPAAVDARIPAGPPAARAPHPRGPNTQKGS